LFLEERGGEGVRKVRGMAKTNTKRKVYIWIRGFRKKLGEKRKRRLNGEMQVEKVEVAGRRSC